MRKAVVLTVCVMLVVLPALIPTAEGAGKTKIQIGDSKTKTQKSPIMEILKSRKVSFYFNETPITKAISFISDLTQINFVVDIPAEKDTKVSLRVKKMTLGNALHWLCKLAKVKFSVVDDAIYVGNKPTKKKILKVYNIKDLLYPARDFPGPTMTLKSDDDEGDWKLPEPVGDEDKIIDPQVIIDTIKRITQEEPEEQ